MKNEYLLITTWTKVSWYFVIRNIRKFQYLIGVAFALMIVAGIAQAGVTLDTIQKKKFIKCGVNIGISGFSNLDKQGNWTGFDVDFCKAIAAAVFGDADKVKYIPLTAKERFLALQSGEIDILSRNTTWTLTRDTMQGFNFVGVIYYDGQGFMVNKNLGITTALELDGATVCINAGTTTELNLADYFREHNMQYTPVVFDTNEQTVNGFESGRCDVLTSDISQLYSLRLKLAKPTNNVILPKTISKEPLGPAVRQGDDEWFNIVKWILFALISAEEMGITSQNVEKMQISTASKVKRLLGGEGSMGKAEERNQHQGHRPENHTHRHHFQDGQGNEGNQVLGYAPQKRLLIPETHPQEKLRY